MAKSLSAFMFTPMADQAVALEGWGLAAGEVANALAGDDSIVGGMQDGSAAIEFGLQIQDAQLFAGPGSDHVEGVGSRGGVRLLGVSLLDLGEGDNVVLGRALGPSLLNPAKSYYGLGITASISAGSGRDRLEGVFEEVDSSPYTFGIFMLGGVVDLGSGCDVVSATSRSSHSSSSALLVTSTYDPQLLMGDGRDVVSCYAQAGVAADIAGLVSMGDGCDLFEAQSAKACALLIESTGYIDLGAGRDRVNLLGDLVVRSSGRLDLGAGCDQIVVDATNRTGVLLFANAVIDLGDGADVISGVRHQGSGDLGNRIVNDGLIQAGSGDDVVDALGGFYALQQAGRVEMGQGDDVVKGFGLGTFDGGDGAGDALLLGQGVYVVDQDAGTIVSGSVAMNVSGFERLAGFAQSDFFAFASGTLTVDSAGVGQWASAA